MSNYCVKIKSEEFLKLLSSNEDLFTKCSKTDIGNLKNRKVKIQVRFDKNLIEDALLFV
jgi:hypothetical protein